MLRLRRALCGPPAKKTFIYLHIYIRFDSLDSSSLSQLTARRKQTDKNGLLSSRLTARSHQSPPSLNHQLPFSKNTSSSSERAPALANKQSIYPPSKRKRKPPLEASDTAIYSNWSNSNKTIELALYFYLQQQGFIRHKTQHRNASARTIVTPQQDGDKQTTSRVSLRPQER